MMFSLLLLPQKTPLLCLRMGEAGRDAPSTASEDNFDRDTRESPGGSDGGGDGGGGREGNASCAQIPLPWTSKIQSKLRGGDWGCQEVLSLPSASNSSLWGWWLLRGDFRTQVTDTERPG